MIEIDCCTLKFESTDKTFYANDLIVGISDELRISEGYDGCIDGDEYPLTKEERIELADYMIARWTKYKKQL